VSPLSQFSFGGESACPFGALALADAALSGELDPRAQSEADALRRVAQCLEAGVARFEQYFARRARGHSSPLEIVRGDAALFPRLALWTPAPEEAAAPALLALAMDEVEFPEALLPGGEIQLRSLSADSLARLLLSCSHSHRALTLVNMGYALALLCHRDGSFWVLDTHAKRVLADSPAHGAHVLVFADALAATAFVLECSLDSRAAVLAAAEGVWQEEAALRAEVAIFGLRGA
jgi:hypothetical protein